MKPKYDKLLSLILHGKDNFKNQRHLLKSKQKENKKIRNHRIIRGFVSRWQSNLHNCTNEVEGNALRQLGESEQRLFSSDVKRM